MGAYEIVTGLLPGRGAQGLGAHFPAMHPHFGSGGGFCGAGQLTQQAQRSCCFLAFAFVPHWDTNMQQS